MVYRHFHHKTQSLVCWSGLFLLVMLSPHHSYAKPEMQPTSLDTASSDTAPTRTALWRGRHGLTLGVSALAVGMLSLRLFGVQPNSNAWIGPQFDLDNQKLRDPAQNQDVSFPFEEKQSVPGFEAALFMAGAGFSALLVQTSLSASTQAHTQHLVDTVAGLVETMAVTTIVTEATKYAFGRLRPDFLSRYKVLRCANNPSSEECIAGRLSFISGHSSFSFAMATYASLVIGGRLVWGHQARAQRHWGKTTVGVLGQTLLLGTASYVAYSRTSDHRHHATDVITGALVGIASANLGYWLYFDRDGFSRLSRGTKAQVEQSHFHAQLGLSMQGLSVTGQF